ncbi:MAG: SPOR domain-containing protein [Bacteroidales bacterium]|nr:SPOR domain-containing protein [Bacteroidales bacterium]
MDIRNCIHELLSLHDCVIIPGFGGFIGNYSPARIDPVHHSFNPPAKKLLFNTNLKQNDGLLANAVAASLGTSYAAACKLIDEFSEDSRLILKSGRPLFLPGVGQLQEDSKGIIYFEQEDGATLLPESFGLVPFFSPPVIRYSEKKFIIPRALKWAAAIVIPIGFATVIGVTQYDNLSANFANNAGVLSSVFSKFSATSLVDKKEAPVRPVIEVVPEEVNPEKLTPVKEDKISIRNNDRFAVIVGAFRMKENAEKLIGELQSQGIEASVFDQSKTGLFRVTIGTSPDRDDAKKLLASVKSSAFSGAWVLAK